MSKEQAEPSYFPPVPVLWPRTDFIPSRETGTERLTMPEEAESSTELGPLRAAQRPADSVSGASERSKNPRLHVTGRLKALPRFRTTARGQVVAEMGFEVVEEDQTRAFTLLAFGKKAEALRTATLTPGMSVEVIGYLHHRTVRHRDGSTRTYDELYTVMLRPATGGAPAPETSDTP